MIPKLQENLACIPLVRLCTAVHIIVPRDPEVSDWSHESFAKVVPHPVTKGHVMESRLIQMRRTGAWRCRRNSIPAPFRREQRGDH